MTEVAERLFAKMNPCLRVSGLLRKYCQYGKKDGIKQLGLGRKPEYIY